MLFRMDGKQITEVPRKQKFVQRMKALSTQDYSAIVKELNEVANSGDVHTSSWIPGSNWAGSVYEPIEKACMLDKSEAGKFFGQILCKVFIDRPDDWCFSPSPCTKGKTYFKI